MERIISERGSAADNEDALFFRSLLPHVNNIPQHSKLRFKNQVQQLVNEFAGNTANTLQNTFRQLVLVLPVTQICQILVHHLITQKMIMRSYTLFRPAIGEIGG